MRACIISNQATLMGFDLCPAPSLTFGLCVVPVLLRLALDGHGDGAGVGALCGDGVGVRGGERGHAADGHGGGELVHHMHRLHELGLLGRGRSDRRRHRVRHRLY